MATTIQYALMAGHAYRTTRDEINWIPSPDGWMPFFPVPDATTAAAFQATNGFEAVSFSKVTGTTTEIVISFAGTGTAIDHVANVALALGNPSSQLAQTPTIWMCW